MLATATVAYASEPLGDALWDELQPLLAANDAEIRHFTSDIPLDPDRATYEILGAKGAYRIFTARVEPPAGDRGRLVGYLGVFVSRSLHQRSITLASLDALFVDLAWRGGRTGRDLIRFAEGQLREAGVTTLYQHVKQRSDIAVGPLLARMGYRCVDEVWAIRLDQEASHG